MNFICVALVILMPAFLSVFAWAEVLRYSKIRIDELGLDEKSARAGRLSESGSDPFDRAMFWEIIQNPSASDKTLTRKIAYRARILTMAAAIATLISIVLLLVFSHMS